MDRVLLHPTYLPSISHMAAMVQAVEVVWEACDNYQKQTYRNRAHISHANGLLVLSIPVVHSKGGERQMTRTVVPDNSFPWQDQHWKSLQSAYRSSPYFEYYEDDLLPLFKEPANTLFDHNLRCLQTICDLLEFDMPGSMTEDYEKEPEGITDMRWLVESKKEPNFQFAPYTQVLTEQDEFHPNLSILDLLFNLGPDSLTYLQQQSLPVLS